MLRVTFCSSERIMMSGSLFSLLNSSLTWLARLGLGLGIGLGLGLDSSLTWLDRLGLGLGLELAG